MGSGYSACRVTVLDNEYAETFEEWRDLVNLVGNKLDEFARFVANDDWPDADDEDWDAGVFEQAKQLHGRFCEAFSRRHPDLSVYLNYHNSSECGDRYDDVNGYFLEVTGFWVVSPEGEKIKEHVLDCGFVQFG